jgi:hypothetical protein
MFEDGHRSVLHTAACRRLFECVAADGEPKVSQLRQDAVDQVQSEPLGSCVLAGAWLREQQRPGQQQHVHDDLGHGMWHLRCRGCCADGIALGHGAG